jgi:hypothetical protein
MWWIRSVGYVVPPCFAALALLLTGALAQQPAPTPPPSQPPQKPVAGPTPTTPAPTPSGDDKAAETMRIASEAVDARKLGWFETTLWQKVDTHGLTYQAEGRYLGGPNQRLRLDLQVKLGTGSGKATLVSDGATLWDVTTVGTETPTIVRLDLKRINEVLNTPGTPPQLRDQFYRDRYFAGLAPLMQSLRQQMVFKKQEVTQWNKHEVYMLSGVATEYVKMADGSPWPPFVPRTCRCYLDKQTLWPHRLEWWGPTGQGGEDALLVQMEFRDPKFPKGENAPAGWAQLFKFDPGKAQVLDSTQNLTEQIARIRMQPSQPAAPPTPPQGPSKQ